MLSLLPWRAVAALVAGLTTLAALVVVYRLDPLTALPSYPAVFVAFFVLIVLPGLVVQAACLPGERSLLVRLAAAPALGLGVAALPGFIALEMHARLETFELLHALFAALAAGVAVAFAPGPRREAGPAAERGMGAPVVLCLVLIALGGIASLPFWAGGRVSADFDDWTYMAYVREYLDGGGMNEEEPFLGTGDPVNPRMRSNVWVVMQAAVSDVTDVPPHDVLLQFMGPVLTAAALLATFALTLSLFRNYTIALLASAIQIGWALTDLSPHEGMGRNLLLRVTEDKMVGAFILFPIGLIFVHRFMTQHTAPSFVGLTAVALALGVVHPVPLVFLAVAVVAFAIVRYAVERRVGTVVSAGALLVPVGIVSVWPFIQRQLLVGVAPGLFGTDGSAITFRDEFHFIDLGSGLIIGDYHMILHPLMLLTLLLAPLLLLRNPRTSGNQLLFAATAGAVVFFFVPVLSTPIAEIMTPQTLWKLPWMIPVAPVLAAACYAVAVRIAGIPLVRRVAPVRLAIANAAAGLVLVAGLAAGVAVQEQFARADDVAFYNWTRGSSLFPEHDRSIFLGGIDRAFSGQWRPNPFDARLFIRLGRIAPDGSVVLTNSPTVNHMLPGVLAQVHPVDFGGKAGEGDRREGVLAYLRGDLTLGELDELVLTYDIAFLVATNGSPALELVERYPRAVWEEELIAYQIYRVVR